MNRWKPRMAEQTPGERRDRYYRGWAMTITGSFQARERELFRAAFMAGWDSAQDDSPDATDLEARIRDLETIVAEISQPPIPAFYEPRDPEQKGYLVAMPSGIEHDSPAGQAIARMVQRELEAQNSDAELAAASDTREPGES